MRTHGLTLVGDWARNRVAVWHSRDWSPAHLLRRVLEHAQNYETALDMLDKIIGIDINPAREAMARQFGMTHFINPKDTENVVDAIVQLTDGGADYSFECIGNTKVMRQALECTHKGWGQSIIIGVAEAGAEISTRPFQLVTGRQWKGSAFGGARGRTDVPRIVDWYMDGKINIDDLITHTMPLEKINEGFDLMKRGESIRGVVIY